MNDVLAVWSEIYGSSCLPINSGANREQHCLVECMRYLQLLIFRHIDLKGFWRWCMLYRTIWLLLNSIHRLVCGSFTKDHNASETGSVSVLRWMGQDRPTQLGPSETASLNHWSQLSRSILPHPPEDGDRSSLRSVVVFCKTSTYQTMDRVQKKPNSYF
jgi:hypothetical protein